MNTRCAGTTCPISHLCFRHRCADTGLPYEDYSDKVAVETHRGIRSAECVMFIPVTDERQCIPVGEQFLFKIEEPK